MEMLSHLLCMFFVTFCVLLSGARPCSEHFVKEKSNDPGNPDYIPSIFPTDHVIRPKQKSDVDRYERTRARPRKKRAREEH